MKTKSILVIALGAAALFASCEKEQEVLVQDSPKTIITVGLSDATKTYMGALDAGVHKVYWSNGDQIAVNGIASDALDGLADNTATAEFAFATPPATPFNILYPAGIYSDATHVTLPAIQTYKAGNFADGMNPMAGYSATGDGSITLNHLCAIVKVNVLRAAISPDTDNLVSAKFKGRNSEQVSGSFSINYGSATLTGASAAAADKEVKVIKVLTTSPSSAVSYHIVVPAGTYANGFDIMVQDAAGDMQTVSKTSSVTLVAGKLYNMTEFEFVPTGDAPATIEIASAEDLINFANAYNAKTYNGQDDLLVRLSNDITFNAAQSAEYNATGGIGLVGEGFYFNGLFDGNGYSIDGLSGTCPIFAGVGKNGRIKNLTIGSGSSFTYSEDVTKTLYLSSIVGYNRGWLIDCENYAPVSCTSATYSADVYLGGMVGIQVRLGGISGCHNYADVTFTSLDGTTAVYMGGILAMLDIHNSGDNATVNHCTNEGNIDRGAMSNTDNASKSPTHVGGVIGCIYTVYGTSGTISLTDLHHTTGNVYGPDMANTGQQAKIPVVVGGLIGGIHGDGLAGAGANMSVTGSTVTNCTVRNNHWNNSTSYGEGIHAGGFVGLVRGKSKNISFSNCEVNNVNVGNIRGYGGGFAGYAREVVFDECDVLASSVVATAQLFYGGGFAGVAYNANVTNSDVTLTKNNKYSLRTRGSNYYSGGIAGWTQGDCTISDCRAYVKLMYQDGGTSNTGVRGWIAGMCAGTTTIKDCGLGGTYGSSTPTITLDGDNFDEYIYGSSSTATMTCTGCYYWDGTI